MSLRTLGAIEPYLQGLELVRSTLVALSPGNAVSDVVALMEIHLLGGISWMHLRDKVTIAVKPLA